MIFLDEQRGKEPMRDLLPLLARPAAFSIVRSERSQYPASKVTSEYLVEPKESSLGMKLLDVIMVLS